MMQKAHIMTKNDFRMTPMVRAAGGRPEHTGAAMAITGDIPNVLVLIWGGISL